MKVIPYAAIAMVMLIGGGAYLYTNSTVTGPLVNVTLDLPVETGNEDKPEPIIAEDAHQQFVNHGPAPELAGSTGWLNTEPIAIEKLKGSVLLLNFWTYSCINCIRTFPNLIKWHEKYKDRGLTVLGVHTPEFNFEKVPTNVETSLKRYGISYPVMLDSNYKTWNAYRNQFWPAIYLIDQNSNIVYTHYGEGNYLATEKAIRTLLGLEGPFEIPAPPEDSKGRTPEIYFGLTRVSAFGGAEKPTAGNQLFLYPGKLAKNKFALEGYWEFNQESAVHTKGFGRIKLNFNASKVYLVAQSTKPNTINVYVDGKLIKGVVIKGSDLYELFTSDTPGEHTMEIEVPDAGLEVFTFTFG